MKPQDVKAALNHDVMYNDETYKMTAYILRSKDGKLFQQAELQESNASSTTIAALEKVKIIDNR